MLQETIVRAVFGLLGALAGAGIAWNLTWAWYGALFPRGVNWRGPTVSWQHEVLFALCVFSGALVGLALTQRRYLPCDDETWGQ